MPDEDRYSIRVNRQWWLLNGIFEQHYTTCRQQQKEQMSRKCSNTTTIALWAKDAIAHAEVEAISDPAGYFATVPACRGAWACGATPEAAISDLEEALADWAELHLRTGNRPPLPVMGGY